MIDNLKQYERSEEHKNVTVCVCDLSQGFCWWDENGERHDEDGFHFPELKMIKADVQILTGKERSAAWQPIFPE